MFATLNRQRLASYKLANRSCADVATHSCRRATKARGQFVRSELLAVYFRPQRLLLVVDLCIKQRPPHVARFVVAIIVDAVYRVFGTRTLANIGKKVSKSVAPQPTLANRNTATAVWLKISIVWIEASLNYVSPALVFRRICCAVLGYRIHPKTATTLSSAATQCVRPHAYGCSAIANTLEISGTIAPLQKSGDSEAAKPLSRKVDHSLARTVCAKAATRLAVPALELRREYQSLVTALAFTNPTSLPSSCVLSAPNYRETPKHHSRKLSRDHIFTPSGKCRSNYTMWGAL